MSPGQIVCLALGLCTAAHTLAAQSTSARLWLGGGTATDLRGVRSSAYALGPSVTFAWIPILALSLAGRATHFTNNAWSLGGSAATALRAPLAGGFGLLLSGNGDAVRTSTGPLTCPRKGSPRWNGGTASSRSGVGPARQPHAPASRRPHCQSAAAWSRESVPLALRPGFWRRPLPADSGSPGQREPELPGGTRQPGRRVGRRSHRCAWNPAGTPGAHRVAGRSPRPG
jgi:hypothetical protein